MGNHISFKEEDNCFEVISEDNSFVFPYAHSTEGLWNPIELSDYSFALLDSPYYSREKDIYDLYFNGIEQRCGRIFPVTVLDLVDFETDDRNLKNYLFVGYQYLLSQIENYDKSKNKLEDYFKDTAVLLVVHNKTFPDFDMDSFLLPLFLKGYYPYNHNNSVVPIYEKPKDLETLKLKSVESQKALSSHYIRELYEKTISSTSNLLTRFILFYQVVELYMELKRREKLDQMVLDYNAQKIDAHQFLHDVKDITSEKIYVNKFINSRTHSSDSCFKSKCDILFKDISFVPDNMETTGDILYSMRNRIVHSYRDIQKYSEDFKCAMEQFENVITECLMDSVEVWG